MTHCLVVPFRPAPGVSWQTAEEGVPLAAGKGTASLERFRDGWALRFDGFATEEEAREQLPYAFVALTRLMLVLRAPIAATWTPRSAIPIQDGALGSMLSGRTHVVNGTDPYVAPSGASIATAIANNASVSRTTATERVVQALQGGLRHGNAPTLFATERLRVAVALHTEAFEQADAKATLLVRSMVFEVLAPPVSKHGAAQRMIGQWRDEIESERSKYQPDDPALEALDSLEREILVRRDASIRSRIFRFVAETLRDRADATAWAKRVRSAYDARSELLHEGQLAHEATARAAEDLLEAAELVLATLLAEGAPDAA